MSIKKLIVATMIGLTFIGCLLPGIASADEKQLYLAAVKTNGKYGFIDTTGIFVIPAQYDFAVGFREGLGVAGSFRQQVNAMSLTYGNSTISAGVETGGLSYIDINGKIVISAKYELAIPFSEGLAIVRLDNQKWGYIDKTGNFIIPAQFNYAKSFSEGLAVVRINEKMGYIDKTGTFVIPARYDQALSFREGLAPVRINEKFGYIDKSGQIVISPQFSYASEFSEGLAAVRLKEQWGYINKSGEIVIPLGYLTKAGTTAGDFTGGLAKVKIDEKYGFIDKTGTLVIPAKYDEAFDFYPVF